MSIAGTAPAFFSFSFWTVSQSDQCALDAHRTDAP